MGKKSNCLNQPSNKMPNSDQQSNYSQLNVEQAYRRMGGRHPTRSNSSLEVHTSPVKNSREWFSQLPNPRSQSRRQEHLTQQTNQPTKKKNNQISKRNNIYKPPGHGTRWVNQNFTLLCRTCATSSTPTVTHTKGGWILDFLKVVCLWEGDWLMR